MLAHSENTTRALDVGGHDPQRSERTWSAIESFLGAQRAATIADVSRAIGLTAASTQHRMYELREMGIVRAVPKRKGIRSRFWELGAEEGRELADVVKRKVIKATQIGIVNSDPLIVALFGPGLLRCVGCQQPQGAPHEEGCKFTGLDIDAIHHRVAA